MAPLKKTGHLIFLTADKVSKMRSHFMLSLIRFFDSALQVKKSDISSIHLE